MCGKYATKRLHGQANMETNTNIGMRLRSEREKINLSQTEIGGQLGVTRQTQAKYENGSRSPDAEYLQAASDIGIDVAFVLSGKKDHAAGIGGNRPTYEARPEENLDEQLLTLLQRLDTEQKKALLVLLG